MMGAALDLGDDSSHDMMAKSLEEREKKAIKSYPLLIDNPK